MPNRDVQWVIGTMVVLAGLLVWRIDAGFTGVNARIDDVRADLTMQIASVDARVDDVRADLTIQIAGVNARVDNMTARMDRIATRLDGFDERLRNVEIAFGKVDQRLLTLERILLPVSEQPGE